MSELQSIANMVTMSAGFRPTATGIQPNFASPLEGLPIPGGPTGQLLSLALGPKFQELMSKAGMTGMGLGHDQNIYDRFQAQQHQTQMQDQLRNSAQLDRASFMGTMKGAAAAMGVPMGGQQLLMANRFADLAVSSAPNIAQMAPELLDQLGGSRGSATVMTSKLANFGRYRMDPISGQMGTDPKSTQALASNIMGDLFSAKNIADMKGISAGQVGGIAENLSLRGLVGGSEFGREGLIRNLGGINQDDLMQRAFSLNKGDGIQGIKRSKDGKIDFSGISAADLDKLTSDDVVASKLRDFDATKVKTSIKAYVGAMAAMRDIFGDAGHPNAPIPALMQALEGMTSGAMGQVDPSKLGQMARQTYYLAKTAGISADTAMVMQQDAAVRGQQLGIESPFAIQATQSSLGFNAAMRAKGALATPVFGGMSESALTQANSNLFQQGIASNFGTKLGTLLRMQEVVGSDKLKNTGLGNVLNAVNKNQETVEIGGRKVKLHEISESDIEKLGTEVGLDKATTQQMLLQAPAAREALQNTPQALNYIRNVAQPADIRTTLGTATAALLTTQVEASGVTDPKLNEKMNVIGADIIADLSKESAETNRDPKKRQAFIEKKLKERLPPEVLAKMNEGKTVEQQKVMLTGLASTVSTNLDTITKDNTTYGKYADISALMDPATLAASEALQQNQANQNKARDITSGIGQASGLRGLINAVKGVNIKDPNALTKIIATTFGGVDTKRIGTKLTGPLGEFQKSQEAVDSALQLLSKAKPEEREQLQANLDEKMKDLEVKTNDLRTAAQDVNAYSETGLTGSDIVGAKASAKGELLSIDNMTVLRTGKIKATPKQLETAKKEALDDLTEKTRATATDGRLADTDPKKIAAQTLLTRIENKEYTISDKDAQARIEQQRKQIKKATPDEIDAVAKKYGVTKEQAGELEAVRRTALRMGIDEDELKKRGLDTVRTGASAVDEQIRVMRDEINSRDNLLEPEAADKVYKAFKGSKDEGRLKLAKEEADAGFKNVISRALDKGTMERVGVSVAKDAEKLEITRQKMTNIVQKATKGDLSKFLLGAFDVSDEDAQTPEQKQAFKQKLLQEHRELAEQSETGLTLLEQRINEDKPSDADAALSAADKNMAIAVAQKKKERVDATDSPDKLIEQYKTAFGIGKDVNTEELKKSLSAPASRNALADIIGTQERIAAVTDDPKALMAAYETALQSKDKAGALDKLKTDYKLDTPEKFERTMADLDTMREVDFEKFKGAEGAKNLSDNLKVLEGDAVASAGRSGDRDINIMGKLTGEFKLTGDTVTTLGDCDLSARSIA